MWKLSLWIQFFVLFFLSYSYAKNLGNEPRFRSFEQPTPYYRDGYGLNTIDDGCAPVSGVTNERQDLAAGCLYPTEPFLQKESNAIIDRKVQIECTSYEYVASNPGEYQFCVFDDDKRVVTGYIVNDEYTEEQPKDIYFFAPKAKVNRVSYTDKNRKSKTEACENCLIFGSEPKANDALTNTDSRGILDKAKAQKVARELKQGTLPELQCKPNYKSIPTKNPDLYFYNRVQGVSDPVCSYNRFLEYKEYIKQASQSMNVDENLLLCLLNRESRFSKYKTDENGNILYKTNKKGKKYPILEYIKDWDPYAVSTTGAVGIGQFVDRSFPYVTNQVLKIKGRNYYQMWKQYFSSIKRGKVPTAEQLKINPNMERHSSPELCGARCEADISIGAAAVYIRYMMDGYGNAYENKNVTVAETKRLRDLRVTLNNKAQLTSTEQDQLKKVNQKLEAGREYMVFMGGAYNRGEGTIEGSMSKNSGAMQWQRNMVKDNGESGGEVDSHMKAIRNCMKALEN